MAHTYSCVPFLDHPCKMHALMAYKCPRCGEPVKRRINKVATHFGLVGSLMALPFASFECNTQGPSYLSVVANAKSGTCGEISRSEFPEADRHRMRTEALFSAGGAVAVVIFLIWLLK